jgi:NAD(P)-dependent dehydrogenase (short-subunit alcohol dehydrogenase family)
VTVGDSGIGRAGAMAFAKEGADVAISFLEECEDARETQRAMETGRSWGAIIAVRPRLQLARWIAQPPDHQQRNSPRPTQHFRVRVASVAQVHARIVAATFVPNLRHVLYRRHSVQALVLRHQLWKLG